jgi:hypothetical protein
MCVRKRVSQACSRGQQCGAERTSLVCAETRCSGWGGTEVGIDRSWYLKFSLWLNESHKMKLDRGKKKRGNKLRTSSDIDMTVR